MIRFMLAPPNAETANVGKDFHHANWEAVRNGENGILTKITYTGELIELCSSPAKKTIQRVRGAVLCSVSGLQGKGTQKRDAEIQCQTGNTGK